MNKSTAIKLALVFIFSHGNHAYANQDLENFVAKAKKNVTEDLLDPDAAKFRNLEIRETTGANGKKFIALCGEINTKNAMGAYTGFKKFNADNESAVIVGSNISLAAIHSIFYSKSCIENAGLLKIIDK